MYKLIILLIYYVWTFLILLEFKILINIYFRLVEESVMSEETDKMITELRLYYNLENSKQLYGNECQFVVIPDEMGLFVKKLFKNYPSFIKVSDLCDDNEEVNIQSK